MTQTGAYTRWPCVGVMGQAEADHVSLRSLSVDTSLINYRPTCASIG